MSHLPKFLSKMKFEQMLPIRFFFLGILVIAIMQYVPLGFEFLFPAGSEESGILSAIPSGDAIVITYGASEALDADEIDFDIYIVDDEYSQNPFESSRARIVLARTGKSPYKIGGLERGHTYHVGVRVVDAEGNEDDNTTVKSVTLDGRSPWSVNWTRVRNNYRFVVPHADDRFFVRWYSLAALLYMTFAFFTGIDTRKILLFIVSSAIIMSFSPPYYVMYIAFLIILYYLLFSRMRYWPKLGLFILYLVVYSMVSLALLYAFRRLGLMSMLVISVFVNSLGKKAIFLFYEIASGKIKSMSMMDFIFYLTFLPLAYPMLPLSPSEFMKGWVPKKKHPIQRTFLHGAASVSWGVCKILIYKIMRVQIFPILNFDVMYAMLDSLHIGTVWLLVFANYILWYFYFSGLYNVSLGLSNMCGFRIRPNFINPLFARDPLDLWKRWNIHYRAWLLRIFYFPLWWRYKITILNVLIVFMISGLSHTFLSLLRGHFRWAYFLYFVFQAIGVILVLIVKKDALVSGDVTGGKGFKLKTALAIAATFVYTSLLHVVLFADFKGVNIYQSGDIYAKLFGLH